MHLLSWSRSTRSNWCDERWCMCFYSSQNGSNDQWWKAGLSLPDQGWNLSVWICSSLRHVTSWHTQASVTSSLRRGSPPLSFQMMTFVVARCCLSWRDRCKGQPTVPSLVSTSSSPLCHLCFFSQPSPPVLCRLLSFLRAFPSLSPLPVSFLLLVPVLPHPWLSAAPICG